MALALNAYALLRLRVSKEGEAIVSTIRLRIKFFNIAVAIASSLLFALAGYAFLENLAHR